MSTLDRKKKRNKVLLIIGLAVVISGVGTLVFSYVIREEIINTQRIHDRMLAPKENITLTNEEVLAGRDVALIVFGPSNASLRVQILQPDGQTLLEREIREGVYTVKPVMTGTHKAVITNLEGRPVKISASFVGSLDVENVVNLYYDIADTLVLMALGGILVIAGAFILILRGVLYLRDKRYMRS